MNIIEQLKQKFVFGWVSEELQAKCREIGTENFEYYDIHGEWDAFGIAAFDKGDRLKLKESYTEKPKVIELEIKPRKGALVMGSPSHGYALYTDAPALCPEDGYYFAGFEYSDGFISNRNTRWVDAKGMFRHCSTKDALNWKLDRPVAALFAEELK